MSFEDVTRAILSYLHNCSDLKMFNILTNKVNQNGLPSQTM